MDDITDPRDVRAMLQDMFDRLKMIGDQLVLDALQGDTVFALGEALGTILKAKALVGRDINMLEKESEE